MTLLALQILFTQMARAQNVSVVNQGERASFGGFIVKDEYFRKMMVDIDQKNQFKSELQSCLEKPPQIIDNGRPIQWYSYGALTGLVVGALVGYHLR
jgi:hypothetical protein